MSELIKSVRVRARQEPSGYKSGAFEGGLLDFKVSIQRISKRERACSSFNLTKTGENGSQFWYALFYKGNRYEDLTDDELIADYIRTNTIRENPKLVDGKIDVMEEIPGEFLPNGSPAYKTEKKPYYEIIQDPFSPTPPPSRVYGRDPYFLNNGAQVYIKWFASEPISVFYEFKNLTSASQSAIGEVTIQIVTNQPNKEPLVFTYSASNNPIQSGLTPSYNDIETYWNWSTRPGLNQISFVGYLSPGERFVDPNSLKLVDGVKYGVESKEYFSIDGYIDDARDSMTPSISIKPEGLVKKVEVVPPTNDDKVWVLSDLTDDIIYDFYPIYKEEIIGTGSSASESSTPNGKSEKYFFDNSFKGDFRTGQDWMILNDLLQAWNKKIPNYNVDIAKPSFVVPNEPINYVDPIKPKPEPEPGLSASTLPEPQNSKLKVYFPPDFEVNVREDCPEFKIFIGEIPKELEPGEGFQFQDDFEDLADLDSEYVETPFNAEEESPSSIPEVQSDGRDEQSNVVKHDPGKSESVSTSSVSGSTVQGYADPKIVKVPTGSSAYSHTDSQGFNLTNSQWYGSLLVSAKAHIDHPTFDISGTDSGNLGCASWVSMVFYRAFGLNMKDGKPVKPIPKSIENFGDKGTAGLGSVFGKNPTLWDKIPYKDGQPGDIINTERNFSTNKAGHIGVVLDEKHKDGSYVVASNSSKGFGSSNDPRGCGKKNYSITKWAEVEKRNPTKTFCWRWKGKGLPYGKNEF
jgi:hypothetical protein